VVAQVTLYKEIITKTPGMFVGGLKLPFRSIRASWAGVRLTIDDGEHHQLRSTEPRIIDLQPGPHTFAACGRGFVSGEAVLDVGEDEPSIVVVSPDHRVSASAETPLGTLRIHGVRGPEELQPYVFYKSLPTSWGHRTLIVSVIISTVASIVVTAAGFAVLGVAVYGLTKAAGVGLFLGLCALVIAPLCIPAGIGGILTAVRFERLPTSWRRPGSEDHVELTPSP
jgi:hypothetical protein